jgi:hypothetical protein
MFPVKEKQSIPEDFELIPADLCGFRDGCFSSEPLSDVADCDEQSSPSARIREDYTFWWQCCQAMIYVLCAILFLQ